MAAFPSLGEVGPSAWWWISYGYRTEPETGRPARLNIEDSDLPWLADHWTKRSSSDYGWSQGSGWWGHQEVYVVQHIDGHIGLRWDTEWEVIGASVPHTRHRAIEIAWKKYFDNY